MRGGSSFNQEACHSSLQSSSRGLLSRSVSRVAVPVCFRVPHGTAQSFFQNVQGGILVSVQNESTARANVGTHTQTFLDTRSTPGAILTGIFWRNRNDGNPMHCALIGQPCHEDTPSCILDRFGKFPVPHHVPNVQVFIGNEIARCHERVCLLSGKIFTLPLNL
jgi:hypothetical protein